MQQIIFFTYRMYK